MQNSVLFLAIFQKRDTVIISHLKELNGYITGSSKNLECFNFLDGSLLI